MAARRVSVIGVFSGAGVSIFPRFSWLRFGALGTDGDGDESDEVDIDGTADDTRSALLLSSEDVDCF